MKNAARLQYLKECLDYDQDTGALSWRRDRPEHHFKNKTVRSRWMGLHAGKEITCVAKNGYIVFNLNKVMYLAHRVIFAIDNDIEMADLPEQIDHIDTCRTNNRRSNLRPATSLLNSYNSSLSKSSKSGFKGVTWSKQREKWRSCIHVDGKQVHLGFFADPKQAHAAYVKAANDHYGEFARAA